MTRVGILSDTHLTTCSDSFRRSVAEAFSDCDTIIHAGDLTDLSVLEAFEGKRVHAVSGNMCDHLASQALPSSRTVTLHGFAIGISHGAGPRHNIEERLIELFPEADCIIFGHTHIPVCRYIGKTLFFNPGSFQGTGRYGAPGTYGILEIDSRGLHPSLHELRRNI